MSSCYAKTGKSENSGDKKVALGLLSVGSTGGTMLEFMLPSVLFPIDVSNMWETNTAVVVFRVGLMYFIIKIKSQFPGNSFSCLLFQLSGCAHPAWFLALVYR